MGVSADAILVYGISLEGPDTWKEDPFVFMLSGADDDDDDSHPDLDAYLDRESGLPLWGEAGHSIAALREFRKRCPVDLVTHCSYDHPEYILAVRDSGVRAYRGYPKSLTELPPISRKRVSRFVNWCVEHGIEGEPQWWLCSLWG